MRKMVFVAVVLGLVGVTALPASAHGAFSSQATDLAANCGDEWHESSVTGKARIQEDGVSGTERFRVKYFLQWWTGSSWQNSNKIVRKSAAFPDDATSYFYLPGGDGIETIDATPAHQDTFIRMRIVFLWETVNPRTVLHKHAAASGSCFVGV
jgi:hypothetical protein